MSGLQCFMYFLGVFSNIKSVLQDGNSFLYDEQVAMQNVFLKVLDTIKV